MKLVETPLVGVIELTPKVFGDDRGYFMESYNKRLLEKSEITNDFIQDNQSLSLPVGTLRGLHYQLNPKAQTKLVRVLKGSIFDVAVDIRKGSPTFGQWYGTIISAENKKQLLVPKGFAHGFITLEPSTEVAYKVDEYYSAENDRGIAWNDPEIGIKWPVSVSVLSEKDQKHPNLRDAEINF